MPRFVLLRHECPPEQDPASHWDFMLEDGAALLTWRLAELPTAGGPVVAAPKLADHRLAYLAYEGPVSGDRGAVRRIDAGEFRWIERAEERFQIDLDGTILRGRLVLHKLRGDSWQLSLE